MDSRMNKYYDNDELENTRFRKNEELYKEINKSELNSYEVKSNSTIIGDNASSIDVEKIKKILDTKYKDVEEKKSLRKEEEKEEVKDVLDDTKEYDIKVILEKAKMQKPDNYEEERLKKLNDTNYDILKKINVNNNKEEKDNKEDLENLINTIALNEKESHKYNEALDMLTDLKGTDDTEVLEGLKEEVTSEVGEDTLVSNDKDMTNSFYTSSNAINKNDFENDDFTKDIDSSNTFLKVVIAIIVVIFIIGIILLIKTIYAS